MAFAVESPEGLLTGRTGCTRPELDDFGGGRYV